MAFTLTDFLLQPENVVALACVSALLSGVVVALAYRGALVRREREWFRGYAELERLLAAEQQRGLRVPELEVTLHQRERQIEALRCEKGEAEQTVAALGEALRQQRAQTEEKLALLNDARERMSQEFRVLADAVMRAHSQEFGERNRAQIGALLDPVREKLGEYQQGLQATRLESARERAALGAQIRALAEASAAMTTETAGLTRALRGQAQVQGAWGEMVLATVLERAGLRAGEEFSAQVNLMGAEGQRLRPDVVVNLPGGQAIVVDAKVSLIAFARHVNAEDAAARAAHLAAHVGSMRAHIRELAERRYPTAIGGALDFVIMFVPIEGALAAAVQAAPELTALAAECRVAIATPTTLLIALRTVANVWQVDRRNRNAEEIARRAGSLYDKFVGFLEDLGAVGARLDQARESYDKAMAKLSSGKGNLVRQAEQLRELGASTGRSMPPAFTAEEAGPARPVTEAL